MRRVAAAAVVAGILWSITAVEAAPPLVRGIDVTTVISLDDRVRAAQAKQGASAASKLHKVRTIVIDPGHGGSNHGACGVAKIDEKELTLELAFALRRALQSRYPHLRVILTRYGDRELDLAARIALANTRGADLFLSLHYNAATHDRALGVETFFLLERPIPSKRACTRAKKKPDNAKLAEACAAHRNPSLRRPHPRSQRWAEIVQRQLIAALKAKSRGVKRANFGVLRGANMPAIVVESGFLSHPKEGRSIVTRAHRDQIVDALIRAVTLYDAELKGK